MTKRVSPLRQRMIDDMTIRNMSPNTQKAYIRAVKNFSRHFGKSPDKLSFEDVREYQLHLVSRGLQAATIIPIMCAIRFFYCTMLGRPNVAEPPRPPDRHHAGLQGAEQRLGAATRCVAQAGAMSVCGWCNIPRVPIE